MRLSLTITESQANSMIAHAQHGLPNEACGLLGGKSGHVSTVYPGTNAEHSPIRYLLDPIDQFNAMKMITEKNKGPDKQFNSFGCSIKWKNHE